MKVHLSKLLLAAGLGAVAFLGTGCNKDLDTSMWWMPDPWSPASFVFGSGNSSTGSGAGGSGGGAGGGGGGGGFNTGGGYNVGGGVPGLGM